ncbi:cation diffusion facilitator family transporter [Roseovarius aestuariivivens]|uniref:cation diffusion facilitator family transporter n=1 Tax=Roseovarius aestuariivivens TaxID=1888910 RepID=UPI00108119C9|nr:cation diffusion facilitator family transporter [Roseovarius aestuariivivens]
MGHGHRHHHEADQGDGRLFLAITVNLGLTVAQVIGGLLSGSLALIADALHNASDAVSLIIAFGARRIARKPADSAMTFGYGRAEMVAALINYTTLIVLGLYLVTEAVMRALDPQLVDGWLVVIIAGVALAVDAATALLTFAMSKKSANIRAAFLHNLADALGSVAVIVAGTLILLFDWRLIDPAVTLLIAGYILWMSLSEIGGVVRMLMLGTPPDLDPHEVVDRLSGVPEIERIHHVHLWQMQEHEAAFEAHIVVAKMDWAKAEEIKNALRDKLLQEFGITHSTLELERATQPKAQDSTIGHDAQDGEEVA